MRRSLRNPPPRMFAGHEMARLMTMIVMLAVILMLILRAREPYTWRMFAGKDDDESEVVATAETPGTEGKTGEPAKTAAAKTESAATPSKTLSDNPSPLTPGPSPARGEGSNETTAKSAAVKTDSTAIPAKPAGAKSVELPVEVIVKGFTDTDPDEAEAIEEEFGAISDKTEQIQPEEMQAYDRVVRWVRAQSFAELQERARKQRKEHNITYSEMVSSPDDFRGKIVAMKLNARMVRKFDKKNRDGAQLYEIWGFTSASGTFLYDAVVVDLPKGFRIGDDVKEQVRFSGYFFKLQGYEARGAKVGGRMEVAPLLIGRIEPTEARDVELTAASDWSSWPVVAVGALFVVLITARMFLMFRPPRRRTGEMRPVAPHKMPLATPEQWLDRPDMNDDMDDEPDGNNLSEDCDSLTRGPDSNGHGKDEVQLFPDGLDDGRSQTK